MDTAVSYNDRLFSGGIRSYFHFARFDWAADQIKAFGIPSRSVMELGCFDGRMVEHLPAMPDRYIGFDANWEGGLDEAKKKYGGVATMTFVQSTSPKDMLVPGRFDLGISLETLEHIPPEMVDDYLRTLAERVDWLVVTVPNEMGPVFLGKWMVKKLFGMSPRQYTSADVFFSLIGRTDRVARHEHKGFNYRLMRRQIERHFDVVKVQGLPMRWLPTWLCFGVGMVGKSKHTGLSQRTHDADDALEAIGDHAADQTFAAIKAMALTACAMVAVATVVIYLW